MVHIAVLSTDHIQRETEMLSTVEQYKAREAHYKEMQKILDMGLTGFAPLIISITPLPIIFTLLVLEQQG